MKQFVKLFEEYIFEEMTRQDVEKHIHDKTGMSPGAIAKFDTDTILDVFIAVSKDAFTTDQATELVDKFEPKTTTNAPKELDAEIAAGAAERDKAEDNSNTEIDNIVKNHANWKEGITDKSGGDIEATAVKLADFLQNRYSDFFRDADIKGNEVIMYLDSKHPERVIDNMIRAIGQGITSSEFTGQVRSVRNEGDAIVVELVNKNYPKAEL